MVTARIDHDTPSLNQFVGRTPTARHWQKRKLQELWTALFLEAFGRVPKASGKRRLRVARHCFRTYDADRFIGGLHPLIDCLTRPRGRKGIGLGLLVDDGRKWLALQVEQVQHPRSELPRGNYSVWSIEEAAE